MAEREADAPGEARSVEPEPAERGDDEDLASLRERVEAEYDFDDFRPADMARMSLEEWEAAFDPETWITGATLLDRVAAELTNRVAAGELFAVVERHEGVDGGLVLAYTDVDYALVRPDGTVEGEGSVVRDVEPVVALCSMDSFEVAEPPAGTGLPDPDSIEPGAGDLGHRLLLAVAAVQVLAGLGLLLSPLVLRLGPGAGALTTVIGLVFLVVGLVIGTLVANARLSDRFRSAAYRDRLRAAGVGTDERPPFLPPLEGLDQEPEGAGDEPS